MKTRTFILNSMIILIVVLSPNTFSFSRVINKDICSSGSICVYSKMPVWNQGDETLKDYINRTKNLNLERDPGWCGAVASAMFLRGIATERAIITDMPDEWDANEIQINPYIVKAGDLVKTDYTKGVTDHFDIYNGVVKVRSKTWVDQKRVQSFYQPNHKLEDKGLFFNEQSDYLTPSSIKERIKKSKPAQIILLGKYEVKSQSFPEQTCVFNPSIRRKVCTTTWIKKEILSRLEGHFVVINGYEGEFFKIYDPWGRIYNVELNVEKVLIEEKVSMGLFLNGSSSLTTSSKVRETKKLRIKHIGGENGYLSNNSFRLRNQPKEKILVEYVLGWSLLKGDFGHFIDSNIDLSGTQLTNPYGQGLTPYDDPAYHSRNNIMKPSIIKRFNTKN